jgi:hypothetical protein
MSAQSVHKSMLDVLSRFLGGFCQTFTKSHYVKRPGA